MVEKLEEEYRASHVGKGTAAAGVAVGAGVAAFAPTAALAIATTFGTASTGTAIATLSGAAATNTATAAGWWCSRGWRRRDVCGKCPAGACRPGRLGIGAVGIAGGTLLARRKTAK